eukprot:5443706-Prymnesium_polylepis.1
MRGGGGRGSGGRAGASWRGTVERTFFALVMLPFGVVVQAHGLCHCDEGEAAPLLECGPRVVGDLVIAVLKQLQSTP